MTNEWLAAEIGRELDRLCPSCGQRRAEHPVEVSEHFTCTGYIWLPVQTAMVIQERLTEGDEDE